MERQSAGAGNGTYCAVARAARRTGADAAVVTD